MSRTWEPWHMETLEIRGTCTECAQPWPTSGLWQGLCPLCAKRKFRGRARTSPLLEREGHVYRMYDANGTLLYVGATSSLFARMSSHTSKPWWEEVTRIELRHYPTRSEAFAAEREAIYTEHPLHNQPYGGRRNRR